MRDPGTFDEFYSGSVRRVTGLLYAMTGSRAGAEDLRPGELFVNVVCCSGVPVRQTSSLLREVGPPGQLVRQVAIGYTGRHHTSLDADPAVAARASACTERARVSGGWVKASRMYSVA